MKKRAIILAGGKGTRLWPLSRENHPKQFVGIFQGKSLFQLTILRLLGYFSCQEIYIVAGESYTFSVWNQIDAMGGISCQQKRILKQNLIIESCPRSTLPAILLGLKKEEGKSAQEVIFVFPSDHFIEPQKRFIQSLSTACAMAQRGMLVTFGIVPSYPKEGFGYVMPQKKYQEGYLVEKFIEKPNVSKAGKLIKNGAFWNSGIFCFRKDVFLGELARYQPQMYAAISGSFSFLIQRFPKLPNISIDYGLMQPSKKIGLVKFLARWSDLGSWESFSAFFAPRGENFSLGKAVFLNSKKCFSFSADKLIAVIGLDDVIVVDGADSVLVLKKECSDQVNTLFREIKEKHLPYCQDGPTVYRPWGYYTVLKEKPNYKVKEIGVYPRKALSLQKHHFRSEHWNVVQGIAEVTIGGKKNIVRKNQGIFVPKKTKHKIFNPQDELLKIIEVQIGSYLGEDDIQRFEKYHPATF